MPRTSSKVQRLEKEAILRSKVSYCFYSIFNLHNLIKNYQYTREQSDNYISGLNIEVEDENTERHRRHIATRPIRQIQREIDYPVEPLDKMTERIQQEIKRKQQAAAATLASATG
jgi:uncharacterized Rmd1/YagE family protein